MGVMGRSNQYPSVFIVETVGSSPFSYMPLPTECLNGEFEQINEWNVTHVIADKKLPVQSEFESHNKPQIQSRIVNVFMSSINNKHHLSNFSPRVARYSPTLEQSQRNR